MNVIRKTTPNILLRSMEPEVLCKQSRRPLVSIKQRAGFRCSSFSVTWTVRVTISKQTESTCKTAKNVIWTKKAKRNLVNRTNCTAHAFLKRLEPAVPVWLPQQGYERSTWEERCSNAAIRTENTHLDKRADSSVSAERRQLFWVRNSSVVLKFHLREVWTTLH